MKAAKSSKKRQGQAARVLLPVVALLIVALIAVAMLYLRALERETPAEEAAPTPAPTAAPAAATPAPTAEPTPYQPLQLYLDVNSEVEALDIVVCDSEGQAVPGYPFPLEIRYEDGSAHSVATDVNGHYYADYLLPGKYTVSLSPLEGFLAPESVVRTVDTRLDYVPISNIEEHVEVSQVSELPAEEVQSAPSFSAPVEVEELSTPQSSAPDDGAYYIYHYSVGENGFLLLADGSESDVLPVEENGNLAYGIRKAIAYYRNDGTPLDPADIPEGAVAWTDYYIDEYSQKVPLLLGGGAADPAYAISSERGERPSAPAQRVGWVEENGRTYYYAANGRPVSGLKNIDGKLYFFDGTGAKARSLGIDVSYFNSSIDWNAVKAAGIDFAIIRVAGRTWEKGILFEDEDSYRQGKNGGFYLQGAKAAGLQVGVYVYSNATNTNEAVEEASLALEVVKKSGVTPDMPIYFDYEFSGAYPKGRADRLSFAQRAEIVRAFCETVESGGFRAGVYSNEDFFTRALHLEDVADYDLWYAVYTEGFTLPQFRGFDIWQFSETVRVNGMPDFTDMNVIF